MKGYKKRGSTAGRIDNKSKWESDPNVTNRSSENAGKKVAVLSGTKIWKQQGQKQEKKKNKTLKVKATQIQKSVKGDQQSI